MSSSEALYNRLMSTLQVLVVTSNIKQLTNWAWMVVGIIQAKSISLNQIALYLPGRATAESRVTRIRRWLKNVKIDVWAFYRPILEHVLEGFEGQEVVLILDGTLVFGNRMQIFRLSLVHKNRAIPIHWIVIKGKGNTSVAKLETMLRQADACLSCYVKKVTLLADRGFGTCDFARFCLELGWDFNIRIRAATVVTLQDGSVCRIDQLDIPKGKNRYFQTVRVTKQETLSTNLSVCWTTDWRKKQQDLLAIISNQPANTKRIREYGLRMQIEQSFKDEKSGGFDIDHTRLKDPERLERLMLAVAVATLWCHELGEYVLRGGHERRRIIDPGHKRELSIFQLGLRWLKRCLAHHIQFLPNLLLRLSPRKIRIVYRPLNGTNS